MQLLKSIIPTQPRTLPIAFGPLAGGAFNGSSRHSVRKVLGLYEHELNDWLVRAHPLCQGLLDLGAHDGYFAFGCAAAFRRAKRPFQIICFEPAPPFVTMLQNAAKRLRADAPFEVIPRFVGENADENTVALSHISFDRLPQDSRTLFKIDVEGAELDVLKSAGHWLTPTNLFLVEVHADRLLEPIQALARENGIELQQINQQPHWLLGSEHRNIENRWLVSRI